jgi:hypothetical protein
MLKLKRASANKLCNKANACLDEMLGKLPIDVREWADRHIKFILCEPYDSLADTLYIGKADYIINLYSRTCRLKNDLIMAVIAHEISHCYLQHKNRNYIKKQEKNADLLAESWGFKITELNDYLATHYI